MNKEALSLDLDGVVFPRFPVQIKALLRYAKKGTSIYLPPSELPDIERSIIEDDLKPGERLSFWMHRKRRVPEDVKGMLATSAISYDIYGNTGRSSRRPWVEMTRSTLRRDGVLGYFEDIFFKPEGTRTRDSKMAAVAQLATTYDQVTHFDDNPEDALPIARRFPHVNVIIVQDLTTGILFSRDENQRYPNVKRVATLRGGVEVLHSMNLERWWR